MIQLTRDQVSELDRVPIPIEGGATVESCIVECEGGWRTAWARDGGLRKEVFGPVYPDARAAAAASRYLHHRSYGPVRW